VPGYRVLRLCFLAVCLGDTSQAHPAGYWVDLLRQEHAQQDGEIGLPTASMRVEVRVSSPEPAVGGSIAPGTRQARLWPQGNPLGEDAWFMYTRSRS
jgi:hypothetical protein